MSRLTVAFAGLALSLAGCRCGTPEPTCGDVVVSFDTPKDGDTVSGTLDVTVKITDKAGAPMEIQDPKLETQLTTDPAFTTSGAPSTVTTGQVVFTGVTLKDGTNLLKASVVNKADPTCPGTRTITVLAMSAPLCTPPPAVTAVTWQGDTNADNVLNGIEYPPDAGNPVAHVAVNVGTATQCAVAITQAGSNIVLGTAEVTNGSATVEVAGLPNVMDSSYMLAAVVQCSGACRSEPFASNLQIRTVGPSCAIDEPSKPLLGPNDDADATPDGGYQVRAVGTAMNATTMEFKLTGGATPQTTGPQTPMSNGLSHDFTVPSTGETPYVVTLEAKDTFGNVCTASRNVTVDLKPPTITLTSPVASHGAYTSFNIPVTGTVDGANGQSVSCTSTLGNIGGPFTVSSGGTFSGTGSFAQGSQTITCTVTDAAGNVGTTSQTINVNVPAGTCPLTWTRPPASPAYLTRSSGIVSGTPPSLAYQFSVQSSGACMGNVVSLYQVAGTTRTLLNTGATNSTGLYTYAANLQSSAGMTLTFEAQIANPSPASPTVATQQIVVDLDTPTIVVPSAGVQNVLNDTNPAVAGVQRVLSVSPTLPANTTLTICSDVVLTGSPGTCPDGAGFIVPGGNMLTTNTINSFTFPDGTYSLKPVFVSAGSFNAGVYVAFQVDSVRPAVVSATFVGDTNADKVLNATELPSGNPTVVLTLTNAPVGSSVAVVDLGSGTTVGSVLVTSTTVPTSVPLTTLPGLTAANDKTYALEVRVTKPAPIGNANNPAGATAANAVNPQAFFSLHVDRELPTCRIDEPNHAQQGLADDASAAAGYQLRAFITTSNDVGATGVAMTLTGGASPQTFTGGPASGGTTVSNDFTIASSPATTTTYTLAVNCTDAAGNLKAAVPVSVIVDLVAPTNCSLSSPNAAGSPYTVTRVLPITVAATNANGLNAIITTQVGAMPVQPLATLLIANGTASDSSTSFPNGTQTVTMTVTDLAGNSCTSTQTITVNVSSCDVQFTFPAVDPATLNAGDGTVSGTSLTWNLTGTATNCPGLPANLYSGTGGSRTLLSTTTATGGVFSFPVTTAAGSAVHYEVEMNNGSVGLNSVDVTVDVTPPVLSNVLPAAASLFFVAPGNRNLDLGTAGYIVDGDPVPGGAAGAQTTITFNHSGAVGGKAEVLYQNVVVGSINPITAITASPASIAVSLPQSTTGSLVVRLTDVAGNKVEQTQNATVDVVPPANPVLSVNVVANQERTAKVAVSWSASGDDGTSGTVTGYDLRWTTAVVQPTGLANSNDFFNPAKAWAEATNLTTTSRDITVPPLNSYFVYVRAYDEVGNYSGFVAANQLDNLPTTPPNKVTTIVNPRAGASSADQFGVMMAANGSLNSDGVDDLVIGYDGVAGNRIFIHYGAASGFGTAPHEVLGTSIPVVGTASFISTSFGRGVAVGPVSDSGRSDLLVGAPSVSTVILNGGVATLFFGSNAAQLDTSAANLVQFQGTVSGGFLGRVVSIIDDINGDGLSEVLITATGEDALRAKVYLFYGRSVAQWKTLAGCATTCMPIGVASADRVFRGPTPPNTMLGAGLFGRRGTGFVNFGRVGPPEADGGMPKDFGIPASYEAYNKLFLFSGATVNADPAGTTYTTATVDYNGAPDQSMQALGPPMSASNNEGGFGVSAVGNVDIVGSAAPDLVVSYAYNNRVYVFADRTASGFAGGFGSQWLTINGLASGNFGWDTKVVDFTGDGKGDLVIGSYAFSIASAQPGTGIWLLRNRSTAGSEFDQNINTGFNVSHVGSLPAGSSLGGALAKGDFNGDGKIDFAAADHLDGTGKVFVWQ